MLTITTDNNSIRAERNGLVLFIAAKNTVSYWYDNARVYLNPPETVRISETFSDGIEMNGTPVTPDNIESEFADLFESEGGGGGGTTDHTQLSNRDAADQHPFTAVSGTLQDNAGSATLPATAAGTLASKLQALRDNVKQLFANTAGYVKYTLNDGATPPANKALLVYNGRVANNEDIVGDFSVPTFPTYTSVVFSSPIPATAVGTETDVTSSFSAADLAAIFLLFNNNFNTYFQAMYQPDAANNFRYSISDRAGYDYCLWDGDASYDGWFKLYINVATPRVLCVVAKVSSTYKLAKFNYPDASYDTGGQFIRRRDLPPIPMPPASGTFTLQSVDGVLQWV